MRHNRTGIGQPLLFRRARSRALAAFAIASLLLPASALAQGSPWLADPGTGSVSFSYVNQNATEFFRQTTKVKGPLEATGANLAQNTTWFGLNYAISDSVAIDVQSAWARSFVAGGVGPSGGRETYSGIVDSNFSVTWRIVDELVSDAPSVAVRVGAIVPGGYDTGYINSLGDGAPGVETSLIVGKFGRLIGASGEVGYRTRTSAKVNQQAVGGSGAEEVDVPADMFVNLGLFVPAGQAVTFGVDYRMVNALSGIDIGGEGFSPSRFPGLQEDAHILGGRAIISVSDSISLNGFFGQVLAGRNTAVSRILGFGVNFTFGGGAFGL